MNLFIYSSNLYIIYLQHVSPYDDSSTVTIETFNEVILLLICYHFILLTDLLSDPALKFKIGWSLVICVGLMISVNLIIIVVVSLRNLCDNLRRKRAMQRRAQLELARKIPEEPSLAKLEQIATQSKPTALTKEERTRNQNRLAWEQPGELVISEESIEDFFSRVPKR